MLNSGTRTRQPKIAPNAPHGGGGPGGFKSAYSTGLNSSPNNLFQESKNASLSPVGRNTRADLPKKPDKPSNQQIRAEWDKHDGIIQKIVAEMNQTFQAKHYDLLPFIPLDWKIIKAMIWVESSGPSWQSRYTGVKPAPAFYGPRPIQFGNSGDPGLSVIRDGAEHSHLISSTELRNELKKPMNAELCIRGGVALVFHYAAIYENTRIIDSQEVRQDTVRKKDTLSKIAARNRTLVEEITQTSKISENTTLQQGQTVWFRPAHREWILNGWKAWWVAVTKYNGGGDPYYLSKVKAAYQAIVSES
ncbi:MAG: LysM peptidoglycan-binding domain-containing protein [Acidobacteria bacterium]|nr:LysM peptidoglycan-binding domain-containing protein [Acidobacteriota bacterium]